MVGHIPRTCSFDATEGSERERDIHPLLLNPCMLSFIFLVCSPYYRTCTGQPLKSTNICTCTYKHTHTWQFEAPALFFSIPVAMSMPFYGVTLVLHLTSSLSPPNCLPCRGHTVLQPARSANSRGRIRQVMEAGRKEHENEVWYI